MKKVLTLSLIMLLIMLKILREKIMRKTHKAVIEMIPTLMTKKIIFSRRSLRKYLKINKIKSPTKEKMSLSKSSNKISKSIKKFKEPKLEKKHKSIEKAQKPKPKKSPIKVKKNIIARPKLKAKESPKKVIKHTPVNKSLSFDELEYGIKTLQKLKIMLVEATKETSASLSIQPGIELLRDIQDSRKNDMLVKYLSDSKKYPLPTKLKQTLDNGLSMITEINNRNQMMEQQEESDLMDDEYFAEDPSVLNSTTQDYHHEIENYASADIKMPILSSKTKLSHFVLQRSVSPKKIDEMEGKNIENFKNKRADSLSPIKNKANLGPSLLQKNTTVLKNVDMEKVRETDPILSKNKLSMFQKHNSNRLTRVRDAKMGKKIVQLGHAKSSNLSKRVTDSSLGSPFKKRGLDNSMKYRENYKAEIVGVERIADNSANIFENDYSSQWSKFGNPFGSSQKYIFMKNDVISGSTHPPFRTQNNYSTSQYRSKAPTIRSRDKLGMRDDLNVDRIHNFTTENGAAANHRFFNPFKEGRNEVRLDESKTRKLKSKP